MHATRALSAHPASRHAVSPSRAFDELVVRVGENRDRQAFAGLFDHYAPRIKALLMRGGASASAAEELAQETLLTVWRKAHLFDPARASAAAWIFTIARNLRIDHFRRGSVTLHEMDFHLEAEEPAQPDAILSGAQDAQRVRAAMLSLNADQAAAIEMAFFQEQTHAEISRTLGVPLGTVKARIRFGMMKLRACIERDRGDAS